MDPRRQPSAPPTSTSAGTMADHAVQNFSLYSQAIMPETQQITFAADTPSLFGGTQAMPPQLPQVPVLPQQINGFSQGMGASGDSAYTTMPNTSYWGNSNPLQQVLLGVGNTTGSLPIYAAPNSSAAKKAKKPAAAAKSTRATANAARAAANKTLEQKRLEAESQEWRQNISSQLSRVNDNQDRSLQRQQLMETALQNVINMQSRIMQRQDQLTEQNSRIISGQAEAQQQQERLTATVERADRSSRATLEDIQQEQISLRSEMGGFKSEVQARLDLQQTRMVASMDVSAPPGPNGSRPVLHLSPIAPPPPPPILSPAGAGQQNLNSTSVNSAAREDLDGTRLNVTYRSRASQRSRRMLYVEEDESSEE